MPQLLLLASSRRSLVRVITNEYVFRLDSSALGLRLFLATPDLQVVRESDLVLLSSFDGTTVHFAVSFGRASDSRRDHYSL